MKGKRLACVLLLALLVLPLTARADVVGLGPPPRNKDSEAFVQLYADGFTGWDSAYANAFDGVEELVLWRYPNSGQVVDHVNADWYKGNGRDTYFEQLYMDESGYAWGYVGYAYGRRMSWVCLSAPADETLPADPEVVAAVEREVRAMTLREAAPAIVLVAAVAAVTGGLIYVFWRKRMPS